MALLLLALLLVPALGAETLPTPASHFGHPIGVDRELLDWDQVVSYFHALAKASSRIQVRDLGKTAEGRPFIAATIATHETLAHLDRYREIQARLADPRRTSEAEARQLTAEGKTVVLITCSIHATEVASTHTAIEFAYRLLTENTPKFHAILNNTIFLLVPSLNPDGVDIVTRWYRKTKGTPYEGTSPPELYHKYTGHDNNRDWYILSQPETRLTVRLLNAWHPQIVYDIHQQGAYASRMFVPPWLDPVDPNVDALILQQCNSMGAQMAADLTAAGKKGVAINAMYDFWSPSRQYPAYHGGLRILSESASAQLATPIVVRPEQIQTTALGYNPRERSWNYLEPWEGGTWRLRDIINDQLIAMESCLYQAAIRREDVLRNFYSIGKRAVARAVPFAFVIPAPQFDPGAARVMLETLHLGAVEIERASEAFVAENQRYGAGAYVIRMQQPYSGWAKTLLERQRYPDLRIYPGGPPKRPYDVTAQTLPLLMGADVHTITRPFPAALAPAANFIFQLNAPRPGPGGLPASDVDSWRTVNRVWREGGAIWRDPATGNFYTQAGQTPNLRPLARPRIGLYRSWVPDMDEGWTRWVFDQFGFAYEQVLNRDVTGDLRKRFDVIVFPDQSDTTITEGFRRGSMPEEFTGGLGEQEAASLQRFVAQGGTLVMLNHSTGYALDALGVKATNVVQGISNRDFYSPGSLLNVGLDAHDPLAYGVPPEIAIWSEGSPAWEAPPDARIVARYPKSHVLASGWLLGEKFLANRAALLDVPQGAGHVILFGMRPQYRAQSYQTFKLFFNSLVLNSGKP